MGRTLDNALLNLGLKDPYNEAINKLGFTLEDLLEQERDAGLGNGGLGRLAACYLDSSASQELPVWGYGLRYRYGIFQQLIAPDGSQIDAPCPWSPYDKPWWHPVPTSRCGRASTATRSGSRACARCGGASGRCSRWRTMS